MTLTTATPQEYNLQTNDGQNLFLKNVMLQNGFTPILIGAKPIDVIVKNLTTRDALLCVVTEMMTSGRSYASFNCPVKKKINGSTEGFVTTCLYDGHAFDSIVEEKTKEKNRQTSRLENLMNAKTRDAEQIAKTRELLEKARREYEYYTSVSKLRVFSVGFGYFATDTGDKRLRLYHS